MKESLVIETKERAQRGSHKSRRLRQTGRVPAIVYGHGEANEAITVPHTELHRAIRQGRRLTPLSALMVSFKLRGSAR